MLVSRPLNQNFFSALTKNKVDSHSKKKNLQQWNRTTDKQQAALSESPYIPDNYFWGDV